MQLPCINMYLCIIHMFMIFPWCLNGKITNVSAVIYFSFRTISHKEKNGNKSVTRKSERDQEIQSSE